MSNRVVGLLLCGNWGKRIALLLSVQVVQGDQNGYLVPGGIAGSPCPGCYKCGGLDLQVVGVADRQYNLSQQ